MIMIPMVLFSFLIIFVDAQKGLSDYSNSPLVFWLSSMISLEFTYYSNTKN